MTLPQSAFELAESGRFLEAADVIDSVKVKTNDLRVLRAHLDLDIGNHSRARSAAEALLLENLTAGEHAKCWQIISRTDLMSGCVDAGFKAAHRALAAAERSRDPRLLSRLLASHCASLLHQVGIEAATVEMPRLRRAARACGDAYSLIFLHTTLAEMQAKKGLPASAKLSIEIARNLLKHHPNVFQQGYVASIHAAILLTESDYDGAMAAIEEALDCAEHSGSRTIRQAAFGHLAHVRWAKGELAAADEAIRKCIEATTRGSQLEIVVLDTQLQIAMSRRDSAATEALAASLGEISKKLQGGHSYYGLIHQTNWIKWCYRTGRSEEGLARAIASLPAGERTENRNLITHLKLLIAEGLARTGRPSEGATLLAEAMGGAHQPTLEILGEGMRVTGVLTASVDLDASMSNFDRAARFFDAIGNVTLRNDVVDDASESFGLRVPRDPVRNDEGTAASRQPPDASVIERLAAASQLSALPPLVANEFLSLIAAYDVAREAAIVVSDRVDVERPANCESQNSTVHISFGTYRGKRYEIVATPRPEPTARLTLLLLERLARGSLAAHQEQLHASQLDLWPQQTPENQLGLICASDRTQELINTIQRVAGSNVTVLLTGETGVGKEMFARALHQVSPRGNATFLPFNCTTVPRDMFDSQLFGHKRGSFTGAQEDSPGVIRSAAGGTLFLDEIGELSLDVQPKLLRFLESGEIQPLGDPKPRAVDVRIVAATNARLDQLVAEGRFREDLFYRLNIIRINIPPLRERREEIPALVQHFLERFGRELQKPIVRLADETLEYLVLYGWPGNVRQLSNEIRRMVALAEPGSVLMPAHLSDDLIASRKTMPVGHVPRGFSEVVTRIDQPLSAAVDHVERAAIQRALSITDGNLEQAAKMLGLSRKGLYLKRQRLDLG